VGELGGRCLGPRVRRDSIGSPTGLSGHRLVPLHGPFRRQTPPRPRAHCPRPKSHRLRGDFEDFPAPRCDSDQRSRDGRGPVAEAKRGPSSEAVHDPSRPHPPPGGPRLRRDSWTSGGSLGLRAAARVAARDVGLTHRPIRVEGRSTAGRRSRRSRSGSTAGTRSCSGRSRCLRGPRSDPARRAKTTRTRPRTRL